MPDAKQGDTVKVHYTGKLKDGTVFDTSEQREPLEFKIGEGQVIPGFEQAVVGMSPGESKNTEVSADEAYGQHREELVQEVERNQLPDDLEPQEGQYLQATRPQDGQKINLLVTGVKDSSVTLDANHPLAGEDLSFDIRLVEIE